MPLTDQIKNYARKAIESRPDEEALRIMTRPRKPIAVMFDDDGIVPNNPRLPVVVYRRAIDLNDKRFDPGAVVDAIFASNGWGRSWRDTIYDFVHYHSQIHEAMGVARGWAEVEFTVMPDGSVANAHVVDSQPARTFDRAAIEAVQRASFNPGVRDGQPVQATLRRRIEFKMSGG